MSYEKQKRRITVKIIPHSDGKLISFKIPKFLSKLLISFIVIGLIGSSLGFLYYYRQNTMALETIANLRQVKEKNKNLRAKLHNLSQETKAIKTEFKKIQEVNKEIKQLIDYDGSNRQANIKKDSGSNNRQVGLTGDYNFKTSLATQKPETDLLSDTENRLTELKKIVPQKELELKELKNSAKEYKDYLVSKPRGWPIKTEERRITSYFGYRTHPVTGEHTKHEGLDIGVWYGTKVYATGAGRVTHAGWKGGYGRVVIINHGYGFRTIYAHNQRINVKRGDRVKRGDMIAYTGNSGRSTGPHLHYEILVDGRSVDPLSYIK